MPSKYHPDDRCYLCGESKGDDYTYSNILEKTGQRCYLAGTVAVCGRCWDAAHYTVAFIPAMRSEYV
jgi:hypothetical protein